MGLNLRADKFTKPLDLVKYAYETIIKKVKEVLKQLIQRQTDVLTSNC